MSAESLWYQSYTDRGPPLCRRMSRRPHHEQYGVAISLAIARRANDVACRQNWNSVTGETYWYWPTLDRPASSKAGLSPWWMLSPRIVKLADRALAYAEERAARPPKPEREWWTYPDLVAPPSTQRPPLSPTSYSERIDVELRRMERRAIRAARYMIGREAPAWRQWTPRERKVRQWLRPDTDALASARWLRHVRAAIRADHYDLGTPAMTYLQDDRSGTSADTEPGKRATKLGLMGRMQAVDRRLADGMTPYQVAKDLSVRVTTVNYLDWLARTYGRRLWA